MLPDNATKSVVIKYEPLGPDGKSIQAKAEEQIAEAVPIPTAGQLIDQQPMEGIPQD